MLDWSSRLQIFMSSGKETVEPHLLRKVWHPPSGILHLIFYCFWLPRPLPICFWSHVHFIIVFPCHPWSVLRQAFDAPNEPDQTRKHEYFSSDIPVLLHKHMFRHFLLNETELDVISMRTDILWLFAVRSPCEVRMYTKKFLAYFLLEVSGWWWVA